MLADAVEHLHRTLSRSVVNARSRLGGDEADDFVAEEWDVLVLLDACRVDRYAECTPFEGPVETRRSPGSTSDEFIEATFLDRRLHDTVYVTANPHLYMLDGAEFHHVRDCRDAWDEDLQTVLPEAMTDIAGEVATDYPDKRLIVHYMQPHAPYLGETADRLRAEFGFGGWHPDHVSDGTPEDRDRPLIWDLALDGSVEWETVRRAYDETLERALDAVERLLARVDGHVVVSADHGELLGERVVPGGPREWSHPANFDAPQLREVPWHTVQRGSRERVAEPPEDRAEVDVDLVEEQLAALGYAPDDR
jgi:hypothetical protein